MRTTLPLALLLLAACPEIIEGTASSGTSDTSTSSGPSTSTNPTSTDPTTNATTTSTNPTSTDPTSTTNPTTTTDPTPTTTTVGCEGPCVPGEAPEGLSCTDECAYDFSGVPQWICSFGGCTPTGEDVGGMSCDQPDADLFCKFLTGNPDATADTKWTVVAVQDAPGFCCLSMNPELSLGPLPKYGVDDLCYMPTSMADVYPPFAALLASDVKCIEP